MAIVNDGGGTYKGKGVGAGGPRVGGNVITPKPPVPQVQMKGDIPKPNMIQSAITRATAPVLKAAKKTALQSVTKSPVVAQQPVSSGPVGSGGNYAGSSVSGGAGGGISPMDLGAAVSAAPAVTEPVIPNAQEDATYQIQVAELAKALADYQAQQQLSMSQYDQNYGQGLRDLGWAGESFNRDSPGLYGQAMEANDNDFGARGTLRSGLYAKSLGDIATDFANRKTTLDTGKSQYQATQGQALTQMQSQNTLQKQQALREAVARIAATQGVDPSKVPGATL